MKNRLKLIKGDRGKLERYIFKLLLSEPAISDEEFAMLLDKLKKHGKLSEVPKPEDKG